MPIDHATALLQEAIRTSLLVASPVLLAAMGVGLTISVVQTATQLNEQTLTFVPKIITVLVVFALLFPWIMGSLVEFSTRVFEVAARGGMP